MTSLIVLPDIHDQSEHLKRIAKPLHDADVVLLGGDMTNGSINHLLRLLAILEEYNEHIYAVGGNMDTPQIMAHLAREGMNLERRHVMLDGVAILGLGGALPFTGAYVFSEEQLAQHLADAEASAPPDVPKILLAHQPPYGTVCDKIAGLGHVGSHAVRAWIERVQPLVCFCGHIHEAQGMDTIGKTVIVNPAPIWQSSSYAYLEIENDEVRVLEIRAVEAGA